MWKKSKAGCFRVTVAVVVAVVAATISGLDTGAVRRPKMAAVAVARTKMAAVGSHSDRNRRSASAFDQSVIYPSLSYDPSRRHQILNEVVSEDGLMLLNDENSIPRVQRSSSKGGLHSDLGPSGRFHLRPKSSFESKPVTSADGPVRRKHHRMTSSPDYVAPFLVRSQVPPRRHFEKDFGDDFPALTFGSRKSFDDQREVWQRPTQKVWRLLSSAEDNSPDYFLASKRQPPPGFHAIRGKRNSEYETETETETDPDEGISFRQLVATLGKSPLDDISYS